jgi:hypothetical protein
MHKCSRARCKRSNCCSVRILRQHAWKIKHLGTPEVDEVDTHAAIYTQHCHDECSASRCLEQRNQRRHVGRPHYDQHSPAGRVPGQPFPLHRSVMLRHMPPSRCACASRHSNG